VGVALFKDRAAASEVCRKLSGTQADGRKLELVLMDPDNHISFSCRQVTRACARVWRSAAHTTACGLLPALR
jgi:hypothetical protein